MVKFERNTMKEKSAPKSAVPAPKASHLYCARAAKWAWTGSCELEQRKMMFPLRKMKTQYSN